MTAGEAVTASGAVPASCVREVRARAVKGVIALGAAGALCGGWQYGDGRPVAREAPGADARILGAVRMSGVASGVVRAERFERFVSSGHFRAVRWSETETTIADCNDGCGLVNSLMYGLMYGLMSSRVNPADRTARVDSPAVGNGGRTA